MVGGLRLPVMLNLLHSGFSFFTFGWRGFLCFLHETVQHDDALPCQCAVKNACYTIAAFNTKLEKAVTESASMRFSEIAAVYLHAFNKVLVSGAHTQWKFIDLQPDLFAVVLNSIVHVLKYNEIVMLMQALDHLISGRYTVPAPYKTGVGCRNPESNVAHNRAFAVFLCVKHGHIRIMVGRAGQPQGWPGSTLTGIPTPVRLTTNQTVGSLGGELSKLNVEAAIMATVPTLDHPEFSREDLTPLRHADHLNIILDTMQYLSTRSSADARVQLVRLLLVARTHGQKLREELFRIENNITTIPSTPVSKRGQK
ncbi:ash family protein [Salmonella enterica]|nr:ash family protein [Salmonella enterica]